MTGSGLGLILLLASQQLPDCFNPNDYIGQGDAYSYADFPSRAAAQAVLRADPSDPNRLDADLDGIACERNQPPRDHGRVGR